MNRYEHVPHVSLHPNDISVLKNIIRGHLAYLRNGVPASQKRDREVQTLQHLQQRLTPSTRAHAEEMCMLLTADEILALDEAFRCFIALIHQMVSASQARDETLLAIEGLRQRVAVMIEPLSQ